MIKDSQLDLLCPLWDAPPGVKAFFTYRYGGVSTGPYGDVAGFNGLNLGLHSGDKIEDVMANRKLIRQLLPDEPKWLHQVHSTRVVEADFVESEPEADASFTVNKNTVCVVMTADCVPVLLCDTHGEIVAAAHAGWKGLVNGVLQNTVNTMRTYLGEEKREILAWIGPHIRQKSFQVQKDVVDIFCKSCLNRVAESAIIKNEAGYQLNLSMFVVEALRLVGVQNVKDCGLDTFSEADKFYSYRRDRITGRHAAIIYRN